MRFQNVVHGDREISSLRVIQMLRQTLLDVVGAVMTAGSTLFGLIPVIESIGEDALAIVMCVSLQLRSQALLAALSTSLLQMQPRQR